MAPNRPWPTLAPTVLCPRVMMRSPVLRALPAAALVALTACGGGPRSESVSDPPDATAHDQTTSASDNDATAPHQATSIAPGEVTAGGDATATSQGGSDLRDAGPLECSPFGIRFNLTVEGSSPVYFGGPQGQWLDSWGCPWWLAIAPVGGAAFNLAKGGCDTSCPAFRPEPPTPQSYTWDGTYYPYISDASENLDSDCDTPVCAPAGEYFARLCVADGQRDAGAPERPPTCKQFTFTWPPTAAQVLTASITPLPDGG